MICDRQMILVVHSEWYYISMTKNFKVEFSKKTKNHRMD
jgi:hypothetical protein